MDRRGRRRERTYHEGRRRGESTSARTFGERSSVGRAPVPRAFRARPPRAAIFHRAPISDVNPCPQSTYICNTIITLRLVQTLEVAMQDDRRLLFVRGPAAAGLPIRPLAHVPSATFRLTFRRRRPRADLGGRAGRDHFAFGRRRTVRGWSRRGRAKSRGRGETGRRRRPARGRSLVRRRRVRRSRQESASRGRPRPRRRAGTG